MNYELIDSTGSSGPTAEDQLWEKLKLKTDKREIPLSVQPFFPPVSLTNPSLPSGSNLEWKIKPFLYQIEGIANLISRNTLLLADDMGLGKTLQAISALRILIYQDLIESVLVIVPVSLISQWRREIRFLASELRISTIRGPVEDRAYQWQTAAQVFITGYETFRADFTPNPQSPLRRRTWDLVILDEAQKIKNRNTEISRKCKQLRRKRAWALTGTPLENCADDLASILEFTRPLEDGQRLMPIFPGLEMRELHKDLQLRRKKNDVLLDLPPKLVSSIPLPLLPGQRKTYDKAEKEGILQLKEQGENIRISNILELILRLKQICNFCPVTGQSSKFDNIEERIQTLISEGHRAIVFSQFTDWKYGVMAIYRRLLSFNPLVFKGDISQQQREDTLRLFKTDTNHKVLVISLRAGGQGLNLQDASYVFHFDRWWNPAVEHQAEDRSHRLGQMLPVHVYKYTCENTIEERIEAILQKKQHLFDELIDDISIDIRARMTEKEIFGLFGLTPPPKKNRR